MYTLGAERDTPPGRDLARVRPGGGTIFGNDPDRDWERLGAEDPYYAILNTESYRRHRLDETGIDEIFRSGENCVAGFLARAENLFDWRASGRALEFGCGVGRLLLPLRRRFSSVTGVDVSVSMLREAEHHCLRTGVDDVQLLVCDDTLECVQAQFDFILSYLVFQHLPVPRGEAVLRRLLELLRPGGVAALHFTTHRTGPRWRQTLHVLRRNFLPLHCVANLVSGMRVDEPLMQTNLYHRDRLVEILTSRGISAVETDAVQHGDHVGVMLYLRRSQNPNSK